MSAVDTCPEDTKKILASLRNSLAEKTNAYARLSGLTTGEVITLMGGLGHVQSVDQASQITAFQEIVTSLDEALKAMRSSSQQHDDRDSRRQQAGSLGQHEGRDSRRQHAISCSGEHATHVETATKTRNLATIACKASQAMKILQNVNG
jgi:hypothetical protein